MKIRLRKFSLNRMLKLKVYYVANSPSLKSVWRNLLPWQRISSVFGAVLILLSVIGPTISLNNTDHRYKLSQQTEEVVGQGAPESLTKFITIDQQTGDYIYKKDLIGATTAAAANSNKQDGAQYSVTIYKDAKKGVNYYDPDSSQSFTMKPKFDVMAPEQRDGRFVMPLQRGNAQQVITIKGNGVKEDIVLNEYQGDKRSFSYQLDLPASLEAQLTENGEVAIYTGSDTTLFGGQISYGSDRDRDLVEQAQRKAKKDRLVFVLPAPVIKQSDKMDLPPETQSKFKLEGDTLTVESSGLKNLHYPISIDPSTIVTSASDFNYGDDGGNLNISGGTIQRATLTSGRMTATNTNSMATGLGGNIGRSFPAVTAFNDKLYVMGGCITLSGSGSCTADTTNVAIGSINTSSGVVTWDVAHSSGNDLPVGLHAIKATVYNGFIYIAGGSSVGTGPVDTVYYARINTTSGHLGGWQTATNLTSVRTFNTVTAYNGYLYTVGGCGTITVTATPYNPYCGSNNFRNTIEYIRIKSDGSLDSSWNTTAALNVGLTARQYINIYATVYNGKMYTSYTITTGTGAYLSYSYTLIINDDGSLTQLDFEQIINVQQALTFVNRGYAYRTNGTAYSLDSRGVAVMVNENGYMPYTSSGSSACTIDVRYKNFAYCAGINSDFGTTPSTAIGLGTFATSPGEMTGDWSSSSVSTGQSRNNVCAVAYDGFIYQVGGNSGNTVTPPTTVRNSVYSAQLLSTGGIGSWTEQTNTFTTGRGKMTCQVSTKGVLYVIGGVGDSNGDTIMEGLTDIQYSTITSTNAANSKLGVFSTASGALPAGLSYASSAIYNNSDGNSYLYVLAGATGTTEPLTADTNIYYAQIDSSNGNVCRYSAGWVCSGSGNINTATRKTNDSNGNGAVFAASTVINNGKLYILGGEFNNSGTVSRTAAVTYVDITTSGGDITGTWQSGISSMGTARAHHTAVIWNGHIYVLGGVNGTGASNAIVMGNELSTTEYARINSNGSLTWTTGASLDTSYARHGSVVAEGYIYVTSGLRNASLSQQTRWSSIQNGGGGGFSDAESSSLGNLPEGRFYHGVTAYNDYLYVSGGLTNAGGSLNANVYRIKLSDPSGGWQADDSLPAARWGHEMVAYNNYIYVIGGCSSSSNTSCNNSTEALNTVLKAQIGSNGDLGAWDTSVGSGSSFTNKRVRFGSVVHNGYIFIGGGCTGLSGGICGGILNDVYSARIADNSGNLDTWNSSTSFSTARIDPFMTAYNDYLYVGGGVVSGGTPQVDTQYGTISSGSVSGWNTEYHKLAIRGSGAITDAYAENGFMHALGNNIGQGAPISNTGALNSLWNTSSNVSVTNLSSSTYYDGVYYVIGGWLGSALANTFSVYTFTSPRESTYSQFMNTQVDTNPVNMVLNGSMIGNINNPGTMRLGGINATYKSQSVGDSAWGAVRFLNPGTSNILATAMAWTPDNGLARDYIVTIRLDDRFTATFPDSSGNLSSISDFTFYYHPNVGKRLRHGGTFTNETENRSPSQSGGSTYSPRLDAPPR